VEDASPVSKADIDKRLKRLAGQVRGVSRMLEEERDCMEMLTQLAAIQGAARNISVLLLKDYACHCMAGKDDGQSQEQALANLLNVLSRIS
jgi:CsoR family transcriptional regulator, copper-sensing transcriptional repressor